MKASLTKSFSGEGPFLEVTDAEDGVVVEVEGHHAVETDGTVKVDRPPSILLEKTTSVLKVRYDASKGVLTVDGTMGKDVKIRGLSANMYTGGGSGSDRAWNALAGIKVQVRKNVSADVSYMVKSSGTQITALELKATW